MPAMPCAFRGRIKIFRSNGPPFVNSRSKLLASHHHSSPDDPAGPRDPAIDQVQLKGLVLVARTDTKDYDGQRHRPGRARRALAPGEGSRASSGPSKAASRSSPSTSPGCSTRRSSASGPRPWASPSSSGGPRATIGSGMSTQHWPTSGSRTRTRRRRACRCWAESVVPDGLLAVVR